LNTTTASTTEFLDLPDGRLAYDDTGDGTLPLRHEFQPTGVYLDSATYGLPPKAALRALSAVTTAWTSGRYDPVSCDQAVLVRPAPASEQKHSCGGCGAADVRIWTGGSNLRGPGARFSRRSRSRPQYAGWFWCSSKAL
jgi:hypothetical protein